MASDNEISLGNSANSEISGDYSIGDIGFCHQYEIPCYDKPDLELYEDVNFSVCHEAEDDWLGYDLGALMSYGSLESMESRKTLQF